MSQVRHPVFARFFQLTSGQMEQELGRHRDELLAGLAGRVVEIGAGNGASFGHYPATVTELVAFEPEPYLRHKAAEAARRAPVPVRVDEAVAGALPPENGAFDAAVASLVLCTVADPDQALAELRRVLKPGGSCASSSTCARIARARRACRSGWIDRASGRGSRAAVTARATPRRRSSWPDSSSRAFASSRSVLPGCTPIRTSSASPGRA